MSQTAFETILNQLHSDSSDILSSAIVATDGIPLCSILGRHANPDRVGGMAASMLSLGNRAVKEMVGGNLKQTIIEGGDGYIVLVQADEHTVLIVTARQDAKLGMILVYVREAAKKIQLNSHN
ncbi:roadblock/LC7 domain-containing protein [Wielerella bovis]|uniref:roadblock/LC7 domain-containing protein n=1 Tax=Wielerella bovis TaxID=2917790 RepID=UPI0020199ABD|nr:roadblock/LC7 domain-containing protein [Wielerella bovis]MCG7656254.1 roadblock/LC7 domain-containing protein [Wielerella bovis]MCG7658479.1 roadblock/LC7 domain-containing protein [Wielerella bovis]ULJ60572.1 roadblock/LC7 domain-containing protein [Wielerella bovis]ULJ62783.1 roadblock/LC7 domain-containing protein [Wielerella bovis]ULJ65012.1 roadblock/LC7 domain-containing protein [Wielerella bovis]